MLEKFAVNVEASFGRAQARAQEIGATLAAATRSASVAAAGQFESIRDTAAKEREKTAQSLKTAIDQTNAQLSGALDEAAERFRQSVEDVKAMAAEVQRELDATRQELRRGVLELPQETSETAEAMRRVVSDQIRALKELAALVSELGRRLRRRGARGAGRGVRLGGRRAGSLCAAGCAGDRDAPPRRGDLAARSDPLQGDGGRLADDRGGACSAVASANRSGGTAGRPKRRPVVDGCARRPSRRTRPTGRSPAGCRTCSPPPPERSPARPGRARRETLDDLTQSIAGLVDGAAAAETWDRWRRGDAAAVSRRLYTEAGQQAFDEIRRRYQADPQFRETVTRYVQEFERLLAKVGQNDRDGSQWRAYLLSNTGKVYTILAHASGRLG